MNRLGEDEIIIANRNVVTARPFMSTTPSIFTAITNSPVWAGVVLFVVIIAANPFIRSAILYVMLDASRRRTGAIRSAHWYVRLPGAWWGSFRALFASIAYVAMSHGCMRQFCREHILNIREQSTAEDESRVHDCMLEIQKYYEDVVRFGPLTGWIERTLILLFAYYDQLSAVATALAAKGVIVQMLAPSSFRASHSDASRAQPRSPTNSAIIDAAGYERETYFLGTITSFLFAVAGGIFLQHQVATPTSHTYEKESEQGHADRPVGTTSQPSMTGTGGEVINARNREGEVKLPFATEPKIVFMDVDTGVDDALALIAAWHIPSVRMVGVSTVSGNIDCQQALANTIWLRSNFDDLGEFPILGGARASLGGRMPQPVPYIHGSDGLGGARASAANASQPAINTEISSEEAGIDLMLQLAEQYRSQLTIIATGPLTNVAKAFRKSPSSLRCVKEILVMGGALTVPGNITPLAEFNFHCDAQAAEEVLNSGVPIRLFPLDITEKVRIMRSDIDAHREVSSTKRELLKSVASVYMDFHERRYGFAGSYMHDVMPVIALAEPDVFCYSRGRVRVATHPNDEVGWVKFRSDEDGGCVRVACQVDAESFLDAFWALLGNQSPKCTFHITSSD